MSDAVTSAELTQMRADAEAVVLPSTCTIQTVTRTADGMGGWSDSWANTYTSVTCRLAPLGAGRAQTERGEAWAVSGAWVLTVKQDQAIAAGNRVIYSSDTYEVISVQDDHDFRVLRRAFLRRID
ncbi:MAG: head-tail adaptor protein [Anaerolineae bacterium]